MCIKCENTEQQASSSFSEMKFCWEHFKDFVSKNLLSKDSFPETSRAVRPRYLFRGHGKKAWKLEPKFDRTFKSLSDELRTDRHKLLVDNFRKECRHFPEYRHDIEDELRCTALAQHYGLPTRLLDWTDSPYIAAYFAFHSHLSIDHGEKNSGQQEEVVIWVLDRQVDHYWNGDRGVQVVDLMSWCNERLKRQSGWFTFAKMPCRDLEEYVLQLGNKENALRRITLSGGMAELALKDLEWMRISARELFADLTGAATNALIRTVLT